MSSTLDDLGLLTKGEAARLLGISERTLDRMIADDELRAVRLRGRVRIHRADLERFAYEGTR